MGSGLFTRNGFPWPQDALIFHATATTEAILQKGFKTRQQGAPATLGGSWEKSVSFTLSLPRATAIAIGLETLIKGANRIISCVDLLEQLYSEAPAATEMGIISGFNLQDIAFAHDNFRDRFRALAHALTYIDRGWFYYHYFWGPTPEFKQAHRVGNRSWVVPPGEARKLKQENPELDFTGYASIFYELYRSVLSYGSIEQEDAKKEAFNPIWMMTDVSALKSKKFDEVSILICATSIPNVCTDGPGAARLGFVQPEDFKQFGLTDLLDRSQRYCRAALSAGDIILDPNHDSYDAQYGRAAYELRYWNEPKFPGWEIEDIGLRRRSDTMLFHDREEELIIYDPSQVKVESYITVPELRTRFSLGDRLTFPWFDDNKVDVRLEK